MRHQQVLRRAIGATLVILSLVGCGAPAPTATPQPPTSTPTPTPIPPTATPTPVPPTATPTAVPVVTLTGRVLYANSGDPVAGEWVVVTDEEGAVEFSGGILVNPEGTTTDAGEFYIEIEEDFLADRDYLVMVAITINTRLTPMTRDGIPVVLEIRSVPQEIDLGDVFVQR